MDYQTDDYIRGLTSLAKALRLVEGRKSVLFFSTGTPYSIINGNTASGFRPADPSASPLRRDTTGGEISQFQLPDSKLQPLYEAMLKDFSASNCSFYAFDTRESAKVTHLFAYDELSFDARVTGIRSTGASTNVTNPLQDEKTTGQDILKQISKQTGGRYFSNIGLYDKNMQDVQDITGTYYVLGYPISSTADGKFHSLKVEIKRKDCQVASQTGYYDPKPFGQYTKLEKEIQLYDLALNERSEIQAPKRFPAAALVYEAGEGARLRTVARVTREVLDGLAGKNVELVTLLFDEKGNVVSLQRTAADLTPYIGNDLVFSSGAAVQTGSYKSRLVVRNLDTGRSAVGGGECFVGKPPSAGLTVFTPLLLSEQENLPHIDGFVKGKLDRLSWHDVYPYDSAGYAPLSREEVRTGRIAALVPFASSGPDEPHVSFSVRLVNAATAESLPVPAELRHAFRTPNGRAQLLELALDQVPSGDYLVYFYAADSASGAVANAHIPLTVRR